MGAVRAGRIIFFRPQFSAPVRVAEFVEDSKNFARHRDNHVVDGLGRELAQIDGFVRFLPEGGTQAEEQDEKEAQNHGS